MSEMGKVVPTLDTIKRAQELLPSFYRKQAMRDGGGPLAWCMAGVAPEILYAFELNAEWPESFGAFCASKGISPRFMEQAEADGYSPDLCSYVRNTLGYASRMAEVGGIPPEAPKGGMGMPTMLLGSGITCDPRLKWFQTLGARYLKVPVFHTDSLSPAPDGTISAPLVKAHYVEMLRETLQAQIDFIAGQLGRPIDVDRLRNALTVAQEQSKLTWEIHQLRAAVPCPMSSEEFFYGCVAPLSFMTGEPEAIAFMRTLRDELRDRVARGIGVIQNERYRMLWMGLPPWYNLGFFNRLGDLGIVFPVETVYFQGEPVDVDLSDPLEGFIERSWKRSEWARAWGSEIYPDTLFPCNMSLPGTELMRGWVKQFKLDGVIMHRTRSCRAVSFGQVHMKNIFAEEGIPSLIIESDMGDPRTWQQSAILSQVKGLLATIDSSNKTGIPA